LPEKATKMDPAICKEEINCGRVKEKKRHKKDI